MSTSTEKIYDFLEQLDGMTDEQLDEALPVPPRAARMAITAASTRVPTDAAQLDEWALAAAAWCLNMRSDDAPRIELAQLTGDGAPAPLALEDGDPA